MKYLVLLAALAALQPAVLAMPVDADAGAGAGTDAAPPESQPQAGAGDGTDVAPPESQPEAGAGDGTDGAPPESQPQAGEPDAEEAAKEVAESLEQAGLAEDAAQQVAEKAAQEIKEGDTDSAEGVAGIIGDVSKEVADVVPDADDTTTQVPAIMAAVKDVIDTTMGEDGGDMDPTAVVAVAAAAAAAGESSENVAGLIQSAMESTTAAASGNGTDSQTVAKRQNRGVNGNFNNICSSDRCRNLVDFSLQMANSRRQLPFISPCISLMNELLNSGVPVAVFVVYKDGINGLPATAGVDQLQNFLSQTTQDLGRQNRLPRPIVDNFTRDIPECFRRSQFLGGFGQPGRGNFGQPGQGNFGQPGRGNNFGQPGRGNNFGQPGRGNTFGQTGRGNNFQPGRGNTFGQSRQGNFRQGNFGQGNFAQQSQGDFDFDQPAQEDGGFFKN